MNLNYERILIGSYPNFIGRQSLDNANLNIFRFFMI